MDFSKLKPQHELKVDKNKQYLWVVYGINGHLKRLHNTIKFIEASPLFSKSDKVVFLGNVMGTGPDTMKCLIDLDAYAKKRDKQVVYMRGVNELNYLRFDKNFFNSKLGARVAESYYDGTSNPSLLFKDVAWVERTPSMVITHNFVFAFGGINPNIDLKKQDLTAVMYQPFATTSKLLPCGKKVVNMTKDVTNVRISDSCVSLPLAEDTTGVLVLDDTSKDEKYVLNTVIK